MITRCWLEDHTRVIIKEGCSVGDYFQVIADVDATEAEAPVLAESIVRWLAGKGVILNTATDCVLGAVYGYPPGPRFGAITAHPSTSFLSLRTNGVEVSAGRQVFLNGQGELGAVVCPRCEQTIQLSDPATGQSTGESERFTDALRAWDEGGPALVSCPRCARIVGFNDWRWVRERPFAVGFFGVTFWNWPELSARFIEQVADHLGHRVVVTGGKL
jgi:hypothetical protein